MIGLKEQKKANVILSEMQEEAKKRMKAGTGDSDNLSGGLCVVK